MQNVATLWSQIVKQCGSILFCTLSSICKINIRNWNFTLAQYRRASYWNIFSPSDIDECLTAVDNCDDEAICDNDDGGFICICNPGFSGDGVTCLGNFIDPSADFTLYIIWCII